jgi:hypothetical protein
LFGDTFGSNNTADGALALEDNTTGGDNTAGGYGALQFNSTGQDNTATGFETLRLNKASNNTADGAKALQNNTTGQGNTATWVNGLLKNTTGQRNTAAGVNAMFSNTTGSNNTPLGFDAGFNLTTGGNNGDIGNFGVAAESNTIRIGTQGTQTKAFIACISGAAVGGSAVVVSSTGQLGIVASSARYKRDIHDMDAASSHLMKLRPVTFRYKQDQKGERRYGLIGEEVVRLYPYLVSYDADGKVVTVRYHELVPMLTQRGAEADRGESTAKAADFLPPDPSAMRAY